MTVNKSRLCKNISDTTGHPVYGVQQVLDVMIDQITKALARGEKVSLPGFLFLEPVERGPHRARNPSTGDVQTFPATKTAKIRISAQLRDAINGR